jgi:ribonuclease-3
MLNRLQSLHNKTQQVETLELPYNSNNVLLQDDDLRKFFDENGLENIKWNNINLYRNALVHRSYCTMKNDDFTSGNERCPSDCLPLQEMSYERLEFLGDSILSVIVSRYLYERYPDQPEGFLSRVRTKIVNGKMLGSLAEKVGFPKFVFISKQIEESQGRLNYKIMEDVFEAFIGAILIDFQNPEDEPTMPKHIPMIPLTGAGYYIAEKWVISIIEKFLDFAELIQSKTNYKDMLVRYMQHTYQDIPRFFEVSIDIKNGRKEFKYCVKNKSSVILGTATGLSKKEAENQAAYESLLFYGQSPDKT